MKVLIGFECSGEVRRAFRARGHEAYSCDLEPSDDASPHHLQQDVLPLLTDPSFDLMILHPPCTYLANSGVRWLKDPSRWSGLDEGCAVFSACLAAAAPASAWKIPSCTATRKSGPYEFGERASKKTGLWLKNLPPLEPTDILPVPMKHTPEWFIWQSLHFCPPGPNRAKIRSKTFHGIAQAMAEQWSSK